MPLFRPARHAWALLLALSLPLSPAALAATDRAALPPDSPDSPDARIAERALILDLAQAASRVVAVGERGIILVSEDRQHWRQIEAVPTHAMLTAVSAVGDALWAVGHDGTILHSADGGLSWQKQREDVLDTSSDAAFDPRQGMPLLDVLMLDQRHGFAVGAYAQLLRTDDGGAHWHFVATSAAQKNESGHAPDAETETEVEVEGGTLSSAVEEPSEQHLTEADLALEAESDPHFNAIARTGSGALFIVGERGAAYRSRDQGQSWERLQLPYAGSMFGVLGFEGEQILVFGMRGKVYESVDLGQTWVALDTGVELSLMGGTALDAGGFALAGANGIVVTRASAAAAVKTHTHRDARQETPVLSGALPEPDGQLLLSGERGISRFTPGAH